MNTKGKFNSFYSIVFIILLYYSCKKDPSIKSETLADTIQFVIPEGWPYPHYDFSTNPLTKQGFVLGRRLFYDGKLSKDNTISCSSCHQKVSAFSHFHHALSNGIYNQFGTRNAPGIFNLNWQTNFMWDGGVNHIEVQPLAPITNPVEMNETLSNVANKLQNDTTYPQLFKAAFGTETITGQLIFKALAQFMGMLVSDKSKYDFYTRGQTSLTASETNGLTLFQQKCATCHTPPLFTNLQYMNNGLDSVFSDAGRAIITGIATDSGKFKVPSLRNVLLTPPYMHDGRFATLDAVLDHYIGGVKNSSTLSSQLAGGIPFTEQEKQDIISFLSTLSDNSFINDKRFSNPF